MPSYRAVCTDRVYFYVVVDAPDLDAAKKEIIKKVNEGVPRIMCKVSVFDDEDICEIKSADGTEVWANVPPTEDP